MADSERSGSRGPARRLPRGKRREALETYLRDVVLASFQVLAYDGAAAHWHGIERARLEGLSKLQGPR
jgi:tRNA(fMet)-specific endonuclease VapC